MNELTEKLSKLEIHSSNKDKIIVNTTKEEVWTTMMLVLTDISNNDKHEYYEDIMSAFHEISQLYGPSGFSNKRVSSNTDMILLKMMNEYENLIRCFRHYFSDCIQDDESCAITFEQVRTYMNNHKDNIEDYDMIDIAFDDSIKYLRSDSDNYKIMNIIILSEVPMYLPSDISYKMLDALEHLNFTFDI